MHLRLATRADLPAIVAIYNASIPGRQATADLEPVSVESREAWFEAHDRTTRPLWVASSEMAGETIGWLSFNNFYGRPAYAGTAEVSLYLAFSAQGQGLGRQLLREALRRAPGCGITTMLGFIFGHNTASCRLFASEGFAAWGNLPGIAVLDGRPADLVIYGRRV